MSARNTLSVALLVSACVGPAGEPGELPQPAPVRAPSVAPTSLVCASYTVTDLGIFPGGNSSTGNAIDSAGTVAGTGQVSATFGPSHAFKWTTAAGKVDLGTLGGSYSLSRGISGGRIVGLSELAGGDYHAFLADATGLHDLGTLGGTGIDASSAHGINASGVAVGASRLPNGFQRAARYQGGTVTDLGTLVGTAMSNSYAYAINDAGRIVGVSDRPSGVARAAAWDGGQIIDLGSIGNRASTAVAVNAAGDAVGSGLVTASVTHPLLFRNGQVIDLGVPTGFETGFATSINDAGQIVGTIRHQSGELVSTHGFVSDGTTMLDLNSADIGTWLITGAAGINNSGQIIANGSSTAVGMGVDRRARALLLTPNCGAPEAPHLRSIATATASSTVDAPSEIEPGDVLIAAFEYCADPVDFTPPAGWTLVKDQISGAGTEQVFHALVYKKIATTSEPSAYEFEAPSGVYVSSQVAAYGGVSTVGSVASAQAFASSIAAPSLTTTAANQLLVVFYTDYVYGPWSTAPGMTQQSDFDANSLQDELRTAAGPTGTRTATNSYGALSAVSLVLQ